ncbi:MAG: Ig-like domain-containing protein [Candidatus Cryptobacteroides sp.]|nr:Ig-like domain-containing protein [Bacteroidales bacterium]MDD7134130.1 Ig-like domain-containing protein [Bacteroidales bacterium]MDY2774383.1 Ig-like domain-containing protein [Candidatus Cryptobacteroides sp.]
MKLSKFLMGGAACAALLLLSGCDDALKEDNGNNGNGGNEEPEKVKVEFSQNEISIPVNGTSTLELTVTPIKRADEVTVEVADDEVVSIVSKTVSETAIVLELKAVSLNSTTVFAFHDDLDSPVKCVVKVSPIGVESIQLDKTAVELRIGETVALSASVLPEDATSPRISWKSEDESIAAVDGGIVTGLKEGKTTVTAICQEKEAKCEVSVAAIRATSIKLTVDGVETAQKHISVNEKFKVDAEILPEDVSYKTVEWSVADGDAISFEPIVIDGSTVSAYVTAVSPGTAKLVAKIEGGSENELTATIEVSVQQVARPSEEPKIGDYFYSDGTWSDGGLISINEDGTGAKWLTGLDKPAPDPNKTVIGIVFQTNQERISQEEKDLGYTHGLVFSLKAAFAPISTKPNADHRLDSLTCYAMSTTDISSVSVIPHAQTEACYNDIWGYSWNKAILSAFPKGTSKIQQVPAFDWVHTDFSPAAPSNTSGWYIPSSGQLWDLVANLCGDEVIERLAEARLGNVYLYRIDQDYEGLTSFNFNPVAKLNSYWALVPDEMKHNLKYSRDGGNQKICELMSSSLYSQGEDSQCVIFWLADNGEIYPYMDYQDDSVVCHPVLSF